MIAKSESNNLHVFWMVAYTFNHFIGSELALADAINSCKQRESAHGKKPTLNTHPYSNVKQDTVPGLSPWTAHLCIIIIVVSLKQSLPNAYA